METLFAVLMQAYAKIFASTATEVGTTVLITAVLSVIGLMAARRLRD